MRESSLSLIFSQYSLTQNLYPSDSATFPNLKVLTVQVSVNGGHIVPHEPAVEGEERAQENSQHRGDHSTSSSVEVNSFSVALGHHEGVSSTVGSL